MDRAAGLRGSCALLDRPGSGLRRAGRKEGDQPQLSVRGANQALQPGALQSEVVEKELPFVGIVERRDLGLHVGRDYNRLGAFVVGDGSNLLHVLIPPRFRLGQALREIALRHVGGIQHRLVREQKQLVDEGAVGGRRDLEGAGPLPVRQMLVQGLKDRQLLLSLLVAAVRGLLVGLHALSHRL